MSESIEDIIAELSQPFPVESLHFRVGAMTRNKDKAIALAYIDSRDAMKRLDSVVGAHNWQRRYPWSDGKRLYCEVGIRLAGEWVWKGDGAGDTQVEAEKGAFSDAFKRACVNWGIGQYLYDSPNNWWPVNDYKSFEPQTVVKIKQAFNEFQKQYFGGDYAGPALTRLVEAIESGDPIKMLEAQRDKDYDSVFTKLKTKQKAAARDLGQEAAKMVTAYVQSFKEAAANDDAEALNELTSEIESTVLKRAIYTSLDTETQHFVSTNSSKGK